MQTAITQQVKELATTFRPDSLGTDLQDNIFLSSRVQDITAMCCNYVLSIVGKCPKAMVEIEEKCTVILQAIDNEGKPLTKQIKALESEIVSNMTGTGARSSIERNGESQYEVSYRPTSKGRHKLHITVNGRHIRGSPFDFAVTSPVLVDLRTPIQSIKGVDRPCRLAINQRGEVVVTESDKHCLSVFSTSGEKLQSFGTYGSDQGQFKYPQYGSRYQRQKCFPHYSEFPSL